MRQGLCTLCTRSEPARYIDLDGISIALTISSHSVLCRTRCYHSVDSDRDLRHHFWREALIPQQHRVRTDYRNGTSLELGRIALFRFAYLDDARNFKFILLSESCIPLRPLHQVRAVL